VKYKVKQDGVTAKKHLGQHFLKDEDVAFRTAECVPEDLDLLIEIGPGTGVLTQYLYKKWGDKLHCVEIDRESVNYLRNVPWAKGLKVIEEDFLQLDVRPYSGMRVGIVGNYPYNISTQIAFKVLEEPWNVVSFTGMFQKEVAERFCAASGSKVYGITSVLLQSYYSCTYEFTVSEESFLPPPKVKSAVMSAKKIEGKPLPHWKILKSLVKMAFSQRRKTLSNALKPWLHSKPGFELPEAWKGLRAEALCVEDYHKLVKQWEELTH
jgi:16S rRNA (adenine1518-N6/adenine1519-N6)-dimethyltransferase